MSKNNNLKFIKEILKMIENKPMPVVVIFSIIILPHIINMWTNLLINMWTNLSLQYPVTLISVVWFSAIYFQWREVKDWRSKTRLVNYLERHGPWRSYNHLTTEWDAKDDYSKKYIKKLIAKFPNELHDVPMGKYGPGVGINSKTKKIDSNSVSLSEK